MSSLELRELAVAYGKRQALASFSDVVRSGEWLGLIGFVGIVVPHLVRLLAGASYRRVLPLSLLFGATFLIVADIPGRILLKPAETPIGVVTAFLGAPFLILVLRTRGRG